jgi:membrane protease subunit HflC
LTRDAERKRIGKTLVAETYACWRIPDREAVDRFIRRIGTPEQARTILGQLINARLSAATGRMRLEDLITTAPGRAEAQMEGLRQGLLRSLRRRAREQYGIELVDVRLRRFNHPASVRGNIFDRIKSERQKLVQEINSQAATEASKIRSEAEAQARTQVAEAKAREAKIKGEADTEAAQIRNEAHARDPEFYVFLKKMEKLHSILGGNKTVLLLSSHREIFNLLFHPPQPGPGGPAPVVRDGGRPAGNPPPGKQAGRPGRTASDGRPGGQ